MTDTKVTALTENTDPISTDILYMVDDPGGSPASRKAKLLNVVAGSLLASQLVNEIKGWPPIVNTGDLDALNLWWDKVGTPTTAPSVVAGNDGGITFNYNLVLKCVADAGGEGLSQTWTFADEPRVKAGRVMSALLAIWSVGGISITAKLTNSDASHTDAAAVTAAAWTIVEVPNHTLAGTSCVLSVTAGAAGTFYVVPLGANIGARGLALSPRGQRYRDGPNTLLVNGVDPGGTFTDVDCTAATSPLATKVHLYAFYQSDTVNDDLAARRNGDTRTGNSVGVTRASQANYWNCVQCDVPLDDGNIFEYCGGIAAHVESVLIQLLGWWEWE